MPSEDKIRLDQLYGPPLSIEDWVQYGGYYDDGGNSIKFKTREEVLEYFQVDARSGNQWD